MRTAKWSETGVWFWVAVLSAMAHASHAADAPDIDIGRRIYMEGILPDGSPLTGARPDNVRASGHDAACVLCHRPSGLGAVEGDIPVPPISGPALFGRNEVRANMDPRIGKALNRAHEPYDDHTLARAIRDGVRVGGETMLPMMPRYALSAADMKALIAYLKQLSVRASPGSGSEEIRFATVITPEVSASRRAVFKDMVNRIVRLKNGSTALANNPRGARRNMSTAAEVVLGTQRKWAMDIWELSGPPETWEKQLEERYQAQPVFALASGLSDTSWAPIHAFCEKNQIPAWFPSTPSMPENEDFYTIYFTRGVRLEARLLAHYFANRETKPMQVVQLLREGAGERDGADALTKSLQTLNIAVETRVLTQDKAAISVALKDLGEHDAVMAWLRPADIAALSGVTPPAAEVYFSAQLSRADSAPIPVAWKKRAAVVYPYELPEKRAANIAYFRQWLSAQNLPLIDETMQNEVYFALVYLTESVNEMLHNLHRDYLLERAENMLSKRELSKAEEEMRNSTLVRWVIRKPIKAQEGKDPASAGEIDKPSAIQKAGEQTRREGTTVYPRLGVGPNQRFASKGGYIVRFDAQYKFQPDGRWMVP